MVKHFLNKKTFVTIGIYVLILYFFPFVDEWFCTKFSYSESFSLPIIDLIVVLTLVFSMLCLYKWFYVVKYKVSMQQLFILIALLEVFILIITKDRKEIVLTTFSIVPVVPYLSVFGVVLIISIGYSIYSLIQKGEKNEQHDIRYLHEDNPVLDNVDYKSLSHKIVKVIKGDEYEKSFSIGLISPWGTGKSSLLKTIQNDIKHDKKIISIEYSPFLNHNGKDIIINFITVLRLTLGVYSGKLSKHLSEYASAFNEAEKKWDLSKLTNMKPLEEYSTVELYNGINELIKDLNRKIVVFIDDLDRLSSDEIVQVLKLIRNTSNFSNTIFILAFDKSQVKNSLLSGKDFNGRDFIDKFFQLEINLPLISKDKLLNFLFQKIEISRLIKKEEKDKFREIFMNDQLLFDDYIKNYRDVIRLINQLSFEAGFVNITSNEVFLVDWVNLVLFKMKFPEVFRVLSDNPSLFLTDNGTLFRLRETESSNQQNSSLPSDFFDPKKYTVIDQNIANLICSNDCLFTYPLIEKELIIKSLVRIFGQKDPPFNSVMHKHNYYKVVRFKVEEGHMTEAEFQNLLTLKNEIQKNELLSQYTGNEKYNQLIVRLDYIEDKIKRPDIVRLLLNLYTSSDELKKGYSDVLRILAKHLNGNNDQEIIEQITKEFFEYEHSKPIDKAHIISLLVEGEDETKLWGFDIEYIKGIAIDLFSGYLKVYNNNPTDFTLFTLYHRLKKVVTEKALNDELKKYLTSNDPIVFCEQMIQNDQWRDSYYGISSFVKTVFSNFEAFETVLKASSFIEEEKRAEFLHFYNLMSIHHFGANTFVKYKFKFITPHNDRRNIKSPGAEDTQKIIQVYIEILDDDIKILKPSIILGEGQVTSQYFYLDNNVCYLKVETNNYSIDNFIDLLFDDLKQQLHKFKKDEFKIGEGGDFTTLDKPYFILNEGDQVVLKTISIQYG